MQVEQSPGGGRWGQLPMVVRVSLDTMAADLGYAEKWPKNAQFLALLSETLFEHFDDADLELCAEREPFVEDGVLLEQVRAACGEVPAPEDEGEAATIGGLGLD